MTQIKSTTITNFRGIIGELTLDMHINGKPTSVFLLGDNGCGKSSILDAIGFCLRGEVLKTGDGRYARQTLPNLLSPPNQSSSVAVELGSGAKIDRTVRFDSGGESDDDDEENSINEHFRYSRFVIRRRDLVEFQRTPTQMRSTYLSGFGGFPLLAEPDPHWQEFQYQLAELLEKRTVLESAIIKISDVDKNHFPRTRSKLDDWVYAKRGGVPNLKRAERRKLPPLPEDLARPVGQLRRVYDEIRELRKRIYTLSTDRNVKQLNEQLELIGSGVTAAFLKLCPQNSLVKKFVFLAPDSPSPVVSLRLELPNGVEVSPNNVLSEASLDLLALLTLLYMIKAFSGVWPS